MSDETYKYKQGGLMRCCLESLDDAMAERQRHDQPLMTEGRVISCNYCTSTMICQDGYWQWNHHIAEAQVGNK